MLIWWMQWGQTDIAWPFGWMSVWSADMDSAPKQYEWFVTITTDDLLVSVISYLRTLALHDELLAFVMKLWWSYDGLSIRMKRTAVDYLTQLEIGFCIARMDAFPSLSYWSCFSFFFFVNLQLQLYFKPRPADQKVGPPGANGPAPRAPPPGRSLPPHLMGGPMSGRPSIVGPPQRGLPPMGGLLQQMGGPQQNVNVPHPIIPPHMGLGGPQMGALQMGGHLLGYTSGSRQGMRGPTLPMGEVPPSGFIQGPPQGFQLGPPMNQGLMNPRPPPPNMGQHTMHRPSNEIL